MNKEDLLNNNDILHKENTKASPTTKLNQSQNQEKAKETNGKEERKYRIWNDQSKDKSVIILGDSMVKYLNGYGVLLKWPSKCKVYVCNFAGAKTRCMKDYLKS